MGQRVVVDQNVIPVGTKYEYLVDVMGTPRPMQFSIDEGLYTCVLKLIEVQREAMLRREKRLDSLMGWMVFCIFALLCVGVGVGIKLI